MGANGKQIDGVHYKQLSYQPWDLALDIGMNGVLLLVTRYVTRWRDKGGVRDLEKALHCIEKLQEVGFVNIKGFIIMRVIKFTLSYFGLGKYLGYTKKKAAKLDAFCNQLSLPEAQIVKSASLGDFETAKTKIASLINEEKERIKECAVDELVDLAKEHGGTLPFFRG